jgi:S-adenosylmethionine synthetase
MQGVSKTAVQNVTVWSVLRKLLHFNVYKLSIVQGVAVDNFGSKRALLPMIVLIMMIMIT